MALNVLDQRLIDRIKEIGCGAPLGSSGYVKVFCKFPIHLCARCKEKKEKLVTITPATTWMATILNLVEALEQPPAEPPELTSVPAKV